MNTPNTASAPFAKLPTLTLQGIRDKIKSATYTLLPNGRTTVCQLTLENGFTVEGSSACVSAALYNQAKGENYAYEKALDNCWAFEGYLLAERLHSEQTRPPALPDAMDEIRRMLRDDSGYAWGWHCNLAMAAQDAGATKTVADESSARFLQLLAGIDIREFPHFVKSLPTTIDPQVASRLSAPLFAALGGAR